MLTFAQLKASRIPARLGYCATDPRFRDDYNQFQEEALIHGRWWGTTAWVQFCVEDTGCVVLPRNVATVERWAVSGQPANMVNWYWSFLRYIGTIPRCHACGNQGTEVGSCGCGSLYAVDGGTSPVNVRMQSVPGPKFVKLYPRSQTDVGKRVLLQGYDSSMEWVRRSYNGLFVDGEYVTLASPFAVSTVQYKAVTGVQKDVTDMPVLAYSFDPSTGAEVKLSEWQGDEVAPSYRVTRIPTVGCGSCGSSGKTRTVDAIVKLGHIPVASDTDWLLLQNMIAIEHGMRAQQHYAANRDTEGDKEMVRAIAALNHELRTMTGDRQTFFNDLGTIGPNIRNFAGFR